MKLEITQDDGETARYFDDIVEVSTGSDNTLIVCARMFDSAGSAGSVRVVMIWAPCLCHDRHQRRSDDNGI